MSTNQLTDKTKFLMILAITLGCAIFYLASAALGGTSIATTLNLFGIGTTLDDGLVAHWTFDGRDSTQGGSAGEAAGTEVVIDTANNLGASFISVGGNKLVRASNGDLYAVGSGSASNDSRIYRSTDNGATWTRQDSGDELSGAAAMAMVIDSSDVIHLVTDSCAAVRYIDFDTTTNQYGSNGAIIDTSTRCSSLSIDVDSNDIPHIVYQSNVTDTLIYTNRIGGSWGSVINVASSSDFDLTINEDNEPEIVYIDNSGSVPYDLMAGLADANDPTDFSTTTVDASIDDTFTPVSIVIDASDNTWLSAIDDGGDTTLYKHNDTDSWSTWQTPVAHPTVQNYGSLSVIDDDIYLFFPDESSSYEPAFDVYDGSSWAGVVVPDSGALGGEGVIPRWQMFNLYDPTYIDFMSVQCGGAGEDACYNFYDTDPEPGGPNTYPDRSSTANSLSAGAGVVPVAGPLGQALAFDGVDDVATTTALGSGLRTISFWLKADDNTTRKVINIDGTDQIELNGSGQIVATSFPGTTNIYIDGELGSQTTQGQWHHVVVTTSSGVNGSTFELGRVASSYFQGSLDDVRIFNRVLSLDEIKQLYRQGATTKIATTPEPNGPTTSLDDGLVSWWTFDGGDISGAITTSGATSVTENPGAATNRTGVGTVAWTNPGNATTLDGSAASATLSCVAETNYLEADSFGFSIPTNATIEGIELEVTKRRDGTAGISDGGVWLVLADDSVGSTNRGIPFPTFWSTGFALQTYGSSSDLWGETLSPADINDADFGAVITAFCISGTDTAYVDHIGMNVYYQETGSSQLQVQSRVAGGASLRGNVDSATPGPLGQALTFDGTDDVATTTALGSGLRTISFWMKADDNTSRKVINIDGTDQIELNGSGQIVATSFPGTTNIYIDGELGSQTTQGQWHHVVVTDTTGVNGSTFELGRVASSYFQGSLDDVRIFDQVLSEDEIKQLYRQGATTKIATTPEPKGPSTTLDDGLVSHWAFDGGDISNLRETATGNPPLSLIDGDAISGGSTQVASLTVDKPTGTTNGDLLLVAVSGDDDGFDVPTGFTEIFDYTESGATYTTKAGYKVAGGSEPSTYTLNAVSTNERGRAIMWTVRNQTGTDFVATTTEDVTTSNTTAAFSNITVDEGGALVYGIVSTGNGSRSYSSASGWSLLTDNPAASGGSGTANTSLILVERGPEDAGVVSGGSVTIDTSANVVTTAVVVYPDPVSIIEGATFSNRATGGDLLTMPAHADLARGPLGQSLVFDGVDDVATTTALGSGLRTISFWMKADDNTSRKVINIDGTDQIELNGSGQIVATSFPGTTNIYIDGESGSQTEEGEWHHVVVTTSSGVNGSTFELGRVGGSYFDGALDDVRIFDRVITESEIKQLYRLGR